MANETNNPNKRRIGIAVVVAFFVGIIFWGGFNTAMEATNTEEFCISCHEMKNNVFVEYRDTIHYSNRTGVRATCPDCHVPKQWVHKMVRKIQASNELYHKFMGTIDTKAKFEHEAGPPGNGGPPAGLRGRQDLHRLPQGHRPPAAGHARHRSGCRGRPGNR